MRIRLAVLPLILGLSACVDEQARDQASAAEELADAANARAEEAEGRLDEPEQRVVDLEADAE